MTVASFREAFLDSLIPESFRFALSPLSLLLSTRRAILIFTRARVHSATETCSEWIEVGVVKIAAHNTDQRW